MPIRLKNSAAGLFAFIFLSVCTASGALAQSAYPTRPVRIVVVTAAGGGGDMIARSVAQGLTERLGRQVIVENRTGAGGIIGYETVAKSAPDGYTILFCAPTLAINPATHKKVPYDATRDFVAITQVAFSPNILLSHPSLPVKSVKELIAFAKTKPGELLYASAGYGTGPHLAMELFSMMADIRLLHVPYKGATPGMIDLIAGNVALMAPAMVTGLPHVKAGKLRALGITSKTRLSGAADLPTVSESGLPGYETVVWYGLLAPTGTPPAIVARLHTETAAVLQAPALKERFATDGAEVVGNTPEQFAAFINSELTKWAKVAKAAAIKPE
jgi:tripartite-type tricarboxylate transporter receptor subunit TctC